MPDPEVPETPPSKPAEQVTMDAAAFEQVLSRVLEKVQTPAQVREVASRTGISPEQIQALIDQKASEGKLSEGITQAVAAIQISATMEQNEREGRREVESLSNSRKFGTAYDSYGAEFKKWINSRGTTFAGLSTPGHAAESFDYFLKTHTDYYDKLKDKEIETRLTDERKKFEEASRVRTPVSAGAPGLPTGGGHPEGGVLRRLVSQATEEAAELSDDQIEIARNMGVNVNDEATLKRMKSDRALKSSLGTPITSIRTSNET